MKNDAGNENDGKPNVDSQLISGTSNKRREQRHRLKKKSSKAKHVRDASTPTANSADATIIKQELERERRSASCRRLKDEERHASESYTNTYNSQNDILNANMCYSVGNTLQRNYGGRSGRSAVDGADIMRKTYYRGDIIGRKAKSNDFLDRMDVSMTNSYFSILGGGMSGSVIGGLTSLSQPNSAVAKMSRIGNTKYTHFYKLSQDYIILFP